MGVRELKKTIKQETGKILKIVIFFHNVQYMLRLTVFGLLLHYYGFTTSPLHNLKLD